MTISSLSNSYSTYTQSASTADRATQLMSDMDTDKDGKVTESEFSAFGQLMSAQGPMGPPPQQPASESSSTTSSVSATQGATSSQSLFATVDTNADSSLSLDELTSMVAQADTQAAGMQGPPPPPPPSSTQSTGSTSSTSTTSSSSGTDATDTLSSLFSSADTNGDNVLNVDELSALIAQLQANLKTNTR